MSYIGGNWNPEPPLGQDTDKTPTTRAAARDERGVAVATIAEHLEDEQILYSALADSDDLDGVAAAREQLRRLGAAPEDM